MTHPEARSSGHPGLGSLAIAFACLLGSFELLLLAEAITEFAREDAVRRRAGAGSGRPAGYWSFSLGVVALVVLGVGLAVWSALAYLRRGARGWSTTFCLLFLVFMLLVTGYLALVAAAG